MNAITLPSRRQPARDAAAEATVLATATQRAAALLGLNGAALADINAVSGSYFVIGFTNQTLNAVPVDAGDQLFRPCHAPPTDTPARSSGLSRPANTVSVKRMPR